jgi:hypothetical protein
MKPLLLIDMFAVKVNNFLYYFVHGKVRDLNQIWHLYGMLLHLLFSLVDIFGVPLAGLLFFTIHQLRTALQMFF